MSLRCLKAASTFSAAFAELAADIALPAVTIINAAAIFFDFILLCLLPSTLIE